jgi:hypothetical protein
MLLAAAISGRSMSDVLRWGQRQDRAEITPAINVANEPAAATPSSRSGACPSSAAARSTPGAGGDRRLHRPDGQGGVGGTRFTAERLLDGVANTAYVSLPAHEQRRLGPLTVALVQDVIELAFERSRDRGAPIDPALLVVLDDAASSAPLPQLDLYAASAGGHGVQLVTAFRHLSQMRARYDESGRGGVRQPPGQVILRRA